MVDVKITPNNVGDSPVFRKMFERVRKKAGNEKLTVIGDTAYGARENFNRVTESGHKPLFKVRSNSSTLSRAAPARRRRVRRREKRTRVRELATLKDGGWTRCFLPLSECSAKSSLLASQSRWLESSLSWSLFSTCFVLFNSILFSLCLTIPNKIRFSALILTYSVRFTVPLF